MNMNNLKIAKQWIKHENQKVQCQLCPHFCLLDIDQIGKCGVRINHQGILKTAVYENCITTHVDPIEKKPLYHFLPGSKAFSIATMGCNFRCDWCQNWEISQTPAINGKISGDTVPIEDIIQAALESNSKSIAYTYTEPTIFYEYALDIMQIAQKAKLHNVFITNGFISQTALANLLPFMSAANVDLKAFNNDTYKKHINGRLAPVLETMKAMKRAGVWLEITTLIIPTINDSEDEITKMASFICNELGPDTPWHLSRFYPHYRMQHIPLTPSATLAKAEKIAKEQGLHYVYQGNLQSQSANTNCPQCNALLVQRNGYATHVLNIPQENKCPSCEKFISGIWG